MVDWSWLFFQAYGKAENGSGNEVEWKLEVETGSGNWTRHRNETTCKGLFVFGLVLCFGITYLVVID